MVVFKPQLSNIIVISDEADAVYGMQGRTIDPKHVDLSHLDPASQYLVFYGKRAVALSEDRTILDRGFKFAVCKDFVTFENWHNGLARFIKAHMPVRDNLRKQLVENFCWDPNDIPAWGSLAETNANVLYHYLNISGGKLIYAPQNRTVW